MQIIPELSAGGAEQGCIDVAAELVRSGAKAIVVSNGGDRVHELARILNQVRLPAWLPSKTIRTDPEDGPSVTNPRTHPFRHWPTRGDL